MSWPWTGRLFLSTAGTSDVKRRESRLGAEWTLFSVLAVIFLATQTRSTFGFGEALDAVPHPHAVRAGRGGGAFGNAPFDHRRWNRCRA
jgi:hypothetical protein